MIRRPRTRAGRGIRTVDSDTRGQRRRRRGAARAASLLGVTAALGGLMTACSGGDGASSAAEVVIADPAPGSGFPADWVAPELDWTDCEPGDSAPYECATLEVPLDWAEPDGAQIDLVVIRAEASGQRVGTLLTNPGGPGASGVDFLQGNPLGEELNSHFDVVSWDPRGVGASQSLDCDGSVGDLYAADPTPDDEAESAARSAAARRISADCARAGGVMLEHMHTEESARDMEAIRQALGGEELTYIGFSYGTHLGQEYAELFGDRVRAMVLDGVVDPALGFEEFLIGQARAFEASLQRQQQSCETAGAAACGVADLVSAYDEVLERAEQAESEDTVLDGPTPAEVALAATYGQYLTNGWESLGAALGAALDGDPDPIETLASSYVSLVDYGPYAAVVCTDSEHPVGDADYERFTRAATKESPRFGASIASEMLPCASWVVPPRDTAEGLTATGAPPILVVGNTGDPATPLENAEAVAATLRSGVLLVVDREGHVAHGNDDCATRLIDAYLVHLDVPEPGTRC